MSTFLERLSDEKISLDDKKDKLGEFLNSEAFKNIRPVQMSLLKVQHLAMQTYSQCLFERISQFETVEQLS